MQKLKPALRILTGGSEASRLIAKDAERPHQWARAATMARLLHTEQGPLQPETGKHAAVSADNNIIHGCTVFTMFHSALRNLTEPRYSELRIIFTDHYFFQTKSCLNDGEQSSPAVPSQQQLGITGAVLGGLAGLAAAPHHTSAPPSTPLDWTRHTGTAGWWLSCVDT